MTVVGPGNEGREYATNIVKTTVNLYRWSHISSRFLYFVSSNHNEEHFINEKRFLDNEFYSKIHPKLITMKR